MGQYYKAVVLSPTAKKNRIVAAYDPHSHGSYSKLTEHSWIDNPFVQTVESLFAPGEKHYKHPLVWAGDYADPEPGGKDDLYDLCERKETKAPLRSADESFRYLVNHTKKAYLDKKAMPKDKDGWQVHPLPLLTCEGNGRGGGDYFNDKPEIIKHVGSWARDIISVETERPADYTELQVKFEPR